MKDAFPDISETPGVGIAWMGYHGLSTCFQVSGKSESSLTLARIIITCPKCSE